VSEGALRCYGEEVGLRFFILHRRQGPAGTILKFPIETLKVGSIATMHGAWTWPLEKKTRKVQYLLASTSE